MAMQRQTLHPAGRLRRKGAGRKGNKNNDDDDDDRDDHHHHHDKISTSVSILSSRRVAPKHQHFTTHSLIPI